MLVPHLEQIWEPKFIDDSYACRKNKGTHAAVERLRSFMLRVTKSGKVTAWFLQLDIRSFFMSIDREILLDIIQKHLKEESLLQMTKIILQHPCIENYTYRGVPDLLDRVPPHKSLFHTLPGKGLPIGNLTSQFFANIYLNELDQYVKHRLKCQFYVRYMDDFILLDPSKERLFHMKESIEVFLNQKLTLTLKPGVILKRVSEGSDFLGYIVRPGYTLVRNRVVSNMKLKLISLEKQIVFQNKIKRQGDRPSIKQSKTFISCVSATPPSDEVSEVLQSVMIDLSLENRNAVRQTLASYIGHFKHADASQLTQAIWGKNPWLNHLFLLDKQNQLRPLYEPPYIPKKFKNQYYWFSGRYKTFFIFFQVGQYYELYDERAIQASKLLNLKMEEGKRGFRGQCGFPKRLLKHFKKRILAHGYSYIVVDEEGYYSSGLKKRVITEKVLFPANKQEHLN
ncbi:reverse transcriptase domain-containing protein [Deltaproteobacteria bacterium TL4]